MKLDKLNCFYYFDNFVFCIIHDYISLLTLWNFETLAPLLTQALQRGLLQLRR